MAITPIFETLKGLPQGVQLAQGKTEQGEMFIVYLAEEEGGSIMVIFPKTDKLVSLRYKLEDIVANAIEDVRRKL